MDKNLWYLDSTFWYLIAFCGVFLLSLLLCILSFAFPNPYNGFMRHIAYPVIIRRRNSWDSVTRLEFCLIAILFGINVVVIFIPFGGIDWRQIERRAAFTAGVNAIPLCLGGRMGPIVQALNIPRSSYLLFHTWVGRIAVLEAASHAVIVLCLRPRLGPLVTSGWIAFGAFLAILMFSFWFARSRLGPFFLFSHRMFALTSIGALFWHALLLSEITTQILVAVCGVLWLTTTLIRLRKLLFHRLSGEIVEKLRGGDATKIEVALRYPVRVSPGNYFHIFFPTEGGHSYNYLHGYPVVACWHPPDTDNSSEELSHISFILSHSGGHSGAVHRLKAGARILLDGPLGQDLGLGSYETVILLAKGIGIAGVLPMALQLIERLQHDARVKDELQELSRLQQSILQEEKSCGHEEQAAITDRKREVNVKRASLSRKPLFRDATKKVILFWSLDNNSQMDWIADQFKALQKLDPENIFLVVWCGYPNPITGGAPFKTLSNFWKCFQPSSHRKSFDDLIVSKIKEERRVLPGRMLVAACGNPQFTTKVRQGAVDSIGDMGITFVETEFRPPGEDSAPNNGASRHEALREELRELRNLRRRRDFQDTEMRDLTARSSYGSVYSV